MPRSLVVGDVVMVVGDKTNEVVTDLMLDIIAEYT